MKGKRLELSMIAQAVFLS